MRCLASDEAAQNVNGETIVRQGARWPESRTSQGNREEREYAGLNWSADFGDRTRALELAKAEVGATGFYDQLFPNDETNRTLNCEMNRLDEETLVEQCAKLGCRVLILHGDSDLRPAWALDSLVAAFSDVRLEILISCGHLPWLEQPFSTKSALRNFLSRILK
jgi:pimeloyl-ACP methyl ester carboxylesterase